MSGVRQGGARRIFVTGGTGFFGKSMLDYLRRHPGCRPESVWTILTRSPERFVAANAKLLDQDRRISLVTGDVRDFRVEGAYDEIIHAATAAVTTLADDEMLSTIVEGTRHVIEFAKACGARKLLFTSSGAVYGPRTERVDETAECRPATAYGRGKLAAERMLAASGLDVTVARCFAFVGPHLNRGIHYAIGNFLRDTLAGDPIVIQGDGTAFRSYLYADDLVEWLFALLERGAPGRAYNVGSERAVSIRALAETVRQALGGRGDIVVRGRADPAARPSVYVPSTLRARQELGLAERVGLEQAVRLSAGRPPTPGGKYDTILG